MDKEGGRGKRDLRKGGEKRNRRGVPRGDRNEAYPRLTQPSLQSAFTYIISFGSQRILLGRTGNILILGDVQVK